MQQKARRDHLVEVLRLWACLLVVCHHFFCQFLPRPEFGSEKSWILPNNLGYGLASGLCPDLYKSPIFQMLSAGTFSVTLFFILSGYILAKPYFAKATLSYSSIFGDILKRYVRLGFPLYVAGLISLLCSKLALYDKYGVTMGRVAGSGWGTAFFPKPSIADYNYLNVLWAPFVFVHDLVPPTWTIETELIGSYLTYAIVAIIHQSSLAVYICILGFFISPDYYKFFVFGILYAYLEQHASPKYARPWKRFKRIRIVFPLVGFVVILFCLYLDSFPGMNSPLTPDVADTFWAPLIPTQEFLQNVFRLSSGVTGPGACLLFVACKLWVADVPLIRRLAPLGRYTYIIYLAHFILLGTVVSWFYLHLKSAGLAADPLSAVIVTFAFYVVCLVVVCYFLEPLIDGNSITWSHKLKAYYLRSLAQPEEVKKQDA